MDRDDRPRLPTQAELQEPVLAALRELGGSATNEQLELHVGNALRLTAAQREARHASVGVRTELAYRLAWARTRLKQAGAIVGDGPRRWRLK
ncbi:MAG: winged helix-turn-helix domain-containing protein [Myxococcales bacterium]|nr:winged helix-turn-helix domain-containing protein [Myxococcales bacterium]